MNKNIEIISMIYRSPAYLTFISEQMKHWGKAIGWTVGLRIIANDPEPQIEKMLPAVKANGIDVCIYHDKDPRDYYLNRVYRCWNMAGNTTKYDNICFVNSDMAFSDYWLEALLENHNGRYIPCSLLVESGRLPSKAPGISKNFGRTIAEYKEKEFLEYAKQIKNPTPVYGGLYMPCVFETKTFKDSGGFPEGNLYVDGVGKHNSAFVKSGDAYFFERLERELKIKHITSRNSVVYHFQEGEMHDVVS